MEEEAGLWDESYGVEGEEEGEGEDVVDGMTADEVVVVVVVVVDVDAAVADRRCGRPPSGQEAMTGIAGDGVDVGSGPLSGVLVFTVGGVEREREREEPDQPYVNKPRLSRWLAGWLHGRERE